MKGNILYRQNEYLETSDIEYNGKHSRFYRLPDGTIRGTAITLTMSMTDYYLFLEHYDVFDFKILDGCYFKRSIGMFDNYINRYKKMKQENKGAKRQLAKLFLNNLYGKMASSTNSSFKVARVIDGVVKFQLVPEFNKKAGYIPVGAAITSYARRFTITAAQANYYGADKRGFVYADTDSIHCDLSPAEIKGVKQHDTDFCCWKCESEWDEAFFTRQKTYIEHIVKSDGANITPRYEIKCAGMNDRCKSLLLSALTGEPCELDDLTEEQREFLTKSLRLEDFDVGLRIPGKLMPKHIKGGVVLIDTTYEMR